MTKERAFGLDYLRIALALLIFFFHSRDYCNVRFGLVDSFLGNGATSMSAFFMLSGWALFITYYKNNFIDITNLKVFFIKRLVSILPLYYFVSLIFVIFIGKETVIQNIVLFPIEAFGLQALIPGSFPLTHNGGTWFISCILICYLIFPFIKDFFKSINNSVRYWLLASFYILLAIIPIIQLYFRYTLESVYSNPFLRMLEFCIGVTLAAMWEEFKRVGQNSLIMFMQKKVVFFMSLVIWFISTSVPSWLNVPQVGYVAYNATVIPCSMCLLTYLGTLSVKMDGNHIALLYLSSISYGFYLSQLLSFPLSIYLLSETILSGPAGIMIAMCFSVIISIVCHELISKPAKKILMI